jgi:hypothetical protein
MRATTYVQILRRPATETIVGFAARVLRGRQVKRRPISQHFRASTGEASRFTSTSSCGPSPARCVGAGDGSLPVGMPHRLGVTTYDRSKCRPVQDPDSGVVSHAALPSTYCAESRDRPPRFSQTGAQIPAGISAYSKPANACPSFSCNVSRLSRNDDSQGGQKPRVTSLSSSVAY